MACPLLKIGGTENHLHILCRLERVVTASKLLEEVKKSSSKWIKGKDIGLGDLPGRPGMARFPLVCRMWRCWKNTSHGKRHTTNR